MQTILIVEDERDLAELVAFNLEREGFKTAIATDGARAMEIVQERAPDLIILDLMLPGMMGTDICKTLKKDSATARIPVIMLTAKGEEIDRVVGFEVGADDYVVKPFSTRELLLRIKAVLRRSEAPEPELKLLQIGPLAIDMERHAVSVDGVETQLTATEFRLLLNLAERHGRVQSRELLLQNVWGYNYVGDTRTVDTHVTRLRTKLGKAGDMIRTVRGFGYKMEDA